MLHARFIEEKRKYDALVARKNKKRGDYNGIFERWQYPVLTRDHIPLFWKYDVDIATNPHFIERLGVNAVMNAGAIKKDGRYYLVARIEGNDRKSFFGLASSDLPVEGFAFDDYPIVFDDINKEETNVYDMRLTEHEDGYIYGVFCSEKHDASSLGLAAPIASAGIVRTRDLKTWERLSDLRTLRSSQQRNVVLHPTFFDNKYAFYTRPSDGFIDAGSGQGIGFGLSETISNAVIDEEIIVHPRRYHTIAEAKNGAGAPPIFTNRGYLHLAHGVRQTAAGLRYVLYAFATDLKEPWRVIAEPSGYLLAPLGNERVGDVSNVVFCNGAIVDNDDVYIYYASSDTRMHVASTTRSRLTDYVFNTPQDPLRAADCVRQRMELIDKNLSYLRCEDEKNG